MMIYTDTSLCRKHPSSQVKLSPTAQQMWSILQAKKGLVTISDFLALCEKSSPQRKLIQVGGADHEDNFKCFGSANEMLDYLGVDVQKVTSTVCMFMLVMVVMVVVIGGIVVAEEVVVVAAKKD